MNKTLLGFAYYFLLLCLPAYAQTTHNPLTAWQQPTSNYTSIRHEQDEFYKQFHLKTEAQYDSLYIALGGKVIAAPPKEQKQLPCQLQKQVYGWHPYWNSTAQYNAYDYNLLSTFCYFSYELVPSTGSYSDIHAWKTTNSINLAQAAGARVELCVTNFGSSNNTTFLNNPVAWDRLVDSLKSLLNYRNADGVNIDFEGMGSSHKTSFANFMTHLCNRLHTERPGTTVTMALYAVDWSSTFDMPTLNQYVDAFIVMGYDYHYSGGSAGPVAPLYHGSAWSSYPYSLNRTTNYYINQGATPNKFLLGIPYYGIEWPTSNSSVPAGSTTGTGTSRTYSYAKNNYNGVYPYNWDNSSLTPYYVFQSGGAWRQCWWDDEASLGERYDMVRDKGIGGIGIWALGYDYGYNQLWDLIATKFSDCGTPVCSDSAYDTGGPTGNYLNNENYTMSFTNPDGGNVALSFNSFNLEANYDYLYVYDGSSAAAPLIGTYTGTTLPPTLTSTGNTITIRFTSDGATTAAGFELVWQCTTSCNPTTDVTPLPEWITDDFTASFTDTPNCSSSIEERYYLVEELQTNNDWRCNTSRRFFNDDFSLSVLHTDWVAPQGAWAINNGSVEQSTETNSNTNLYAALATDNTRSYLIHWRAMMSGTGTNRRSGLHFFCSDPSLAQRGNSYMIYFRVDQDKAQIYKTTANTIGSPLTDDPVAIDPNIWYDYKVTFNPTTGLINAYVNNVLVSSWTDSAPHTIGSYISLRTADCNTKYDFVRVYTSRTSTTANITAGTNTSIDDTRYESPNSYTPACRVMSIVKASNNKWSESDVESTKVDFSPPTAVSVNDGTTADIDLTATPSQLQANWTTATDPNSDITSYWYAIGTTPGGTDILNWTNNSTNTTFTQSGLNLVAGTTYYISIKSQNGAGLQSSVATSDGVQYCLPTALVNPLNNWYTDDFTANFTDNACGSFAQTFYNVQDYNGSSWRSNGANGFLFDDFATSSIHADWSNIAGTWAVNTNTVYQSDETNSNTNLYALVNQTSNETYLYEWSAKMSGAGTNRRCGIHFFTSNPTATNRGDSYLVWFRADQDKLEIYRNIGDVLTIVQTVNLTVDADVWNNYKVSFNATTGVMDVFRDGVFLTSYTDSAPLSAGTAVSLRNGNCTAWFDNLRVSRLRTSPRLVSVGTNADDARYQSPNPTTDACRVTTIAKTTSQIWTTPDTKSTKIDWTPPTGIAVNDGTSSDIAITYDANQLQANWTTATDPNSGITTYWYAIGTSAGSTNIVNWTSNGSATALTHSGLSLIYGTTYYISVMAYNGAGLSSSPVSSNGQLLQQPCLAPANLSAININTNAATATWAAAAAATSYDLRYQIVGSGNWTTLNTTATSIALSNLAACANYEIQVQSLCSGGNTSGFSPSFTFTTSSLQPNWTPPASAQPSCSGSINLNSLITGDNGGTWSGTGVSGNTFNPTGLLAGNYPITYTVGSGSCQTSQTHNIAITAAPSATWTTTSLRNCDVAISLNALITGTSGGTWSGTGVSGNTFNPSGLAAGNYPVTYIVGTGSCQTTQTNNIAITAAPSAAWTTTSLRNCDAAISLNALVTGTSGGTWSGTGVSGNTFSPSGLATGNYPITYTVDAGSCQATQTHNIAITTAPSAAWTTTSLRNCDAAISLNALITGTSGGVWSGTGVSGNTFNPSGLTTGNYPVTYTIGTGSCQTTQTNNIAIIAAPSAAWTTTSIRNCDAAISLLALLSGNSGGTWSGTGVSGNTFNPSGLAVGNYPVTYTIGTGSCQATQTHNIAVTAAPSAAWITTNMSSCDASIDLNTQLSGTAGGTWSGTGVAGSMFNPNGMAAGNYPITYTVGTGSCVATLTQDIAITSCAPTGVLVQLKLWLEGAYQSTTGTMRTDLRNTSTNILPLSQPYNTAPWYYSGNESLSNISAIPTTTVDWVLIELRNLDNNSLIASQAGLLMQDGSVQDVAGNNGLYFGIPAGNYALVARHRNHLAVISAQSVTVPTTVPYDLTQAANVRGGAAQLINLTSGRYALAAGDVDANGVITIADFNQLYGQMGSLDTYSNNDCSLDRHVLTTDFNLYLPNSSKIGVWQIRY